MLDERRPVTLSRALRSPARGRVDGEEIVAVDTQTGKTDARSTRGERALLTAGVALERGDGPLIVDYVEHDGSPVDLGEGQGMVKIRSRGAALADPGRSDIRLALDGRRHGPTHGLRKLRGEIAGDGEQSLRHRVVHHG